MKSIRSKISNLLNMKNILNFIAGRFLIVTALSLAAFDIHMKFSKVALGLTSWPTGEKLLKRGIDIIADYPKVWVHVRQGYIIVSILGFIILSDLAYRNMFRKLVGKSEEILEPNDIKLPPYPYDPDKLQLIIGAKHNRLNLDKVADPSWLIVPEYGMYQNFLITGAPGTGKTASGMDPFLRQLMFYKAHDPDLKPGMLILDVKGNFWKKVVEVAKAADRLDDLVIIELNGERKYNPTHKPDLKPLVLAGRIKTILRLFSQEGNDSGYWVDKAELLITECIKLCRLYNKGYVTFVEMYRLVNNRIYLDEKLSLLLQRYEEPDTPDEAMSEDEREIFETCRDYFEYEYANLAEKTLSIIQSVVTQMTQVFNTDPDVKRTFCAPHEQLNFLGFRDVIEKGQIVVLKMGVAGYQGLAKTIAAYMKIDFQGEVEQRLSRPGANTERPAVMIADEYQAFITTSDADYFDKSREAKGITILATQSYMSLLNTLKDEKAFKTITQNIINKIWFRSDDSFTVDEIQKQLGQEDREKASRSISENSGDVKKSRILGKLVSDKASVSESVNINIVKENIFDTKFFRYGLVNFTAVSFLSDGNKIMEPTVAHLESYFGEVIKNGFRIKKPLEVEVNEAIEECKGGGYPKNEQTKTEGGEVSISEPAQEQVININQAQVNIVKNERGINNENSKEDPKENSEQKPKETLY